MADNKKSSKKDKKPEKKVEKAVVKDEKPSKTEKVADERPTKAVAKKVVERGPHTLPDEDIDTKGKTISLAPGGQVLFRCSEVKELGKQPHLTYAVKIDGEERYHTKPAKGDKFSDETLMAFQLKVESKTVTVELHNKGLIGKDYLGEVRLDVSELLCGYPFDKWYPLQNKVGKDKKKIVGQVKLQVLYLAPDSKARHDEFTKPLISLIALNRLDLFSRKIEDLGGKGNVSDKGAEKDAVTPLLYAAQEGKAGFVKLLIENGAEIGKEVDKDGSNALHLAAKHGHHQVLKYLLKQKGAPINAADKTPLKNSALHVAAAENQGESVAILIQAGADVNVANGKSDTPLHLALCQQAGAPTSVEQLVFGGADVYALNADDIPAWEVAQRKDLCSSAQTRNKFMKACEVIDAREFVLQQKLPVKQRLDGENLSTDWVTATQFIITTADITEITVLMYPINRTEEYQKQIGFCVIKDNEPIHELPSFQPEGLGFGGSESFRFVVEPEFTYTFCSFCTDKELEGNFGFCIFQKEGKKPISIATAKRWKHTASLTGAWKEETAAGSTFPAAWKNTSFVLTCDSEKPVDAYVMLAQKSKDVSAIVFDDNRIVPARFYIGITLMGTDKKTVLAKSAKWHNSKEVYLKVSVGGDNSSTIILPSTLIAGEEIDYEIVVKCDTKVSLKKNK